jgi:hypothetical protein
MSAFLVHIAGANADTHKKVAAIASTDLINDELMVVETEDGKALFDQVRAITADKVTYFVASVEGMGFGATNHLAPTLMKLSGRKVALVA